MVFDLDRRTAALSVGELADFAVGPRDAGSGYSGLWRAELGTHWHQQLRIQTANKEASAQFEVSIEASVAHRGWVLTLAGRIDQILPPHAGGPLTLREIKTVTRPLPDDETRLRADFPTYFAQLATYLALRRITDPDTPVRGELVFVEVGSGMVQITPVNRTDESAFTTRLEAVVAFLDLRWRARERLRALRFRPAFTLARPGQETTRADLDNAMKVQRCIAFEAPTGFGKTGLLLECALGQMRDGRFNRVLYLTGKSTGQLQVVRTLQSMTAPDGSSDVGGTPPPDVATGRSLAVWQVRAKSEHCVNHTFHCVRENCAYLADLAERWPRSGLARFYLLDDQRHDVDALREAGREAMICPYEITRTALAFNDVWVGDYNYVFAPRNRGLFYDQPGFDPAETLVIIDEAHNLPSRAADCHSHETRAEDAQAILSELDYVHAPPALLRTWTAWTQLLMALPAADSLEMAAEDDIADALRRVAEQIGLAPLDYAALGPGTADRLWETQEISEWMSHPGLRKLLWCPRAGELRFTCIDAAAVIGATLAEYGGVLFASATFGPIEAFAETVGLTNAPRNPAKCKNPPVEAQTGISTLVAPLGHVVAHTPWREGAYRVAYDLRVDTTYKQRARHAPTTAATIEQLHTTAGGAIAVFFPSYRYAEAIRETLDQRGSPLRVALQPRLPELSAQAAWVDESLLLADALFLVLGSSFAESIDVLGGRISHSMVVGPALPEVNAVQAARINELSHLGPGLAFRRVYQIPGMQKVNQALGRLVRAPGQKATVLLHCRRFAEASYASLLARDYQFGTNILDDGDLSAWLNVT